MVRVWDTTIRECVQVFRSNRNEVTCALKLFEGRVFLLGTDSEDLIFVEFNNFGKDPEKGLPIFLKGRGRFTREFFGKCDSLTFNEEERVIALIADKKFVEYICLRTRQEITKKFKRKRKRATEAKKVLEVTKDEFMSDLANWLEPISRKKAPFKLVDLALGRSLRDMENPCFFFSSQNHFILQLLSKNETTGKIEL